MEKPTKTFCLNGTEYAIYKKGRIVSMFKVFMADGKKQLVEVFRPDLKELGRMAVGVKA